MQKRTVRASHCVPQKRAVNMQMRICAFPSPHASQRLGVHRLKLKNNLRGVWPFVTDVQDNSINTTTKDPAFPHSLPLTNHFGHFRRHDSTKKKREKIQSWGDNQQKEPAVFHKCRHTSGDLAAEESISG